MFPDETKGPSVKATKKKSATEPLAFGKKLRVPDNLCVVGSDVNAKLTSPAPLKTSVPGGGLVESPVRVKGVAKAVLANIE